MLISGHVRLKGELNNFKKVDRCNNNGEPPTETKIVPFKGPKSRRTQRFWQALLQSQPRCPQTILNEAAFFSNADQSSLTSIREFLKVRCA